MTSRSVVEFEVPAPHPVPVPRRDWRQLFSDLRRRPQIPPTAVPEVDDVVAAEVPPPPNAAAAARPARPVQVRRVQGDAIEERLHRVAERLLAEADGDPARQERIRSSLADAHARFATAAVRDYLPILVERAVRQQVRAWSLGDVAATA